MKDKIKYIVAVLIAATISVVFVPIMHVGIVKVALFDIVKVGLGNIDQNTVGGVILSKVSDEVEFVVYAIIIFMIIMLFHAVMVAVLKAKASYIYAIASEIIMSVVVFLVYSGMKEGIAEAQTAVIFFGQGEHMQLGKAPVFIWLGCLAAAIILSVLGLVLSMKTTETVTTVAIEPEDFYQDKNPWQPSERNLEDYVPQQPQKPRTSFYGGIKGTNGMFANKIYLLEELVPVCFVKQGRMTFVMEKESADMNLRNRVIDEIIAEVYYVPQYEEYVVKPSGRLKVFLSSGQPLGINREYYLPRETQMYCYDEEQKFILA